MSLGRNVLGTSANIIYTVPADTYSIVSYTVVNQSETTDAAFTVWIGAQVNDNLHHYNQQLIKTNSITRENIVLGAGESIIAQASTSAVISISVDGIETTTL